MPPSPSSSPATARARLTAVRDELRGLFVERDALVDGALAALLSRSHVLVVGPPGSAKSMLAHELCRRVAGGTYFQWLLTKFTTPDELYGAISLRALELDEFRRVTTGKLPEAHVVFLDEVFKASSAILNTLLAVANERIFHNGGRAQPVPLVSLFGATNELPDDDDLGALYDRFLLRYVVDYVEEDFRFLKMLAAAPAGEPRATLSLEDLELLAAAATRVDVPESLLAELARLRRRLAGRGVIASDRRWRAAVPLLRAHAVVAGRDGLADEDLRLLEHVLWSQPDERREVAVEVGELLHGHEEEGRKLLYQAREVAELAQRQWPDEEQGERALIEAHTKLKALHRQLDDLLAATRTRGRKLDALETVRQELEELQRQVLAGGMPLPPPQERQ
jgi:MoxR-like ATPase